jgi:hypothetical protein
LGSERFQRRLDKIAELERKNFVNPKGGS